VTRRETAPIGAPCWVDLFTSDPDKSRAFYGQLFDWTAEEAGEEYGGYINFHKDGVLVAGCMRNDGQAGTPDVWSVYLASDASSYHTGETFVIDLETLESVRPEVESFQLKPQRVFDESVLDLQMLGGEKGTLRPDHRLQLCHIALTVSGERTRRKVLLPGASLRLPASPAPGCGLATATKPRVRTARNQ